MGGPRPYTAPVDQLLTLGEPAQWGAYSVDDWSDYPAKFGFSPADEPELIRMATDKMLDQMPYSSKEVWAPLHAWRALGQMRSLRAVQPLLGILDYFEEAENDSALEELPKALGLIGPQALPQCGLYLANATHRVFARTAAAEAIGEIGKRFPESRRQSIEQLCQTLDKAQWNDESLNGIIISKLMDLRAVEAADRIERVFSRGQVDEMIVGDWPAVAKEMGIAVG